MSSQQGPTPKPKDFPCTHKGCGKSFGTLPHMKRHLRSHSGIKPYECPDCPRKFARSDVRNKHVQSAHDNPDKPYPGARRRNTVNQSSQPTKSMTSSAGHPPVLSEKARSYSMPDGAGHFNRQAMLHQGVSPGQSSSTCSTAFAYGVSPFTPSSEREDGGYFSSSSLPHLAGVDSFVRPTGLESLPVVDWGEQLSHTSFTSQNGGGGGGGGLASRAPKSSSFTLPRDTQTLGSSSSRDGPTDEKRSWNMSPQELYTPLETNQRRFSTSSSLTLGGSTSATDASPQNTFAPRSWDSRTSNNGSSGLPALQLLQTLDLSKQQQQQQQQAINGQTSSSQNQLHLSDSLSTSHHSTGGAPTNGHHLELSGEAPQEMFEWEMGSSSSNTHHHHHHHDKALNRIMSDSIKSPFSSSGPPTTTTFYHARPDAHHKYESGQAPAARSSYSTTPSHMMHFKSEDICLSTFH